MTVEKTSSIVSTMLTQGQRIIDMAEGPAKIREKKTNYLPQFEKEHPKDYAGRVANTYVYDGVGKTIEDMTGKVFDVPAKIEAPGLDGAWLANVDRLGNNVDVFAREAFKSAQKPGISFILADAPPRPQGPLTTGQVKRLNLRPYLVQIPLEQVLGFRFDEINNVPTLTQWRMMESVEVDDPENPYEPQMVDQVRVFEIKVERDEGGSIVSIGKVEISLFRKDNDKGEYVQFGETQQTDLDEIMITAVNINQTGLFMAKPVYDRLAEINFSILRLQSDHDWCQHKSLAPVWFEKMIGDDDDEGGEAAVGTSYGISTDAPEGDARWIEVKGAGIEGARAEIEKRKKEMQSVGLQIVTERMNTATGDIIDDRKANTRLGMWVGELDQAMTKALGWMQELAGRVTGEASFVANKDFSATMLAHLDMQTLRDMYRDGVLSKETYLREAKRRDILAADVLIEDEIDRIDDDENDLDPPVKIAAE